MGFLHCPTLARRRPTSEEVPPPNLEEGPPRPIDSLDWITDMRVKKAIDQFKPNKAAGPDELKPIVLKNLPERGITYIRHLYTACIEIGFTPIAWCHSSVLFMPKQGKKSYREPRSFRPISLAQFLFKLQHSNPQ